MSELSAEQSYTSAEEQDDITFEKETADEHQVYLNVIKAYEEAKNKREKYKKYGPLFVIISGIVFLSLLFSLDSKIGFLILWVVTIIFTVGLMIRAEYNYNKFTNILGIKENKDEPQENTGDTLCEENDGGKAQ